MGVCGFKGNNGGVLKSIVETNMQEQDQNQPPIKPKPNSNLRQESGQVHNDSTNQLPNGDHTVEEKKDNDVNSEMSKRHTRKIRKKVEKILADKSELGDPTEVFTKLERQKNVDIEMFILSSLKKHFLFSNLNDLQLEAVIKEMIYCCAEDQLIFSQGDEAASYFFVIEQGVVQVLINNDHKKDLKKGDSFGELALLYSAPRSASIKADGKCLMYAIDRKSFKKVVEEIAIQNYQKNRQFIDTISFFNHLTNEQKDTISHVLIAQKFPIGSFIVNEGDSASSFYIIIEGEVSVLKGNNLVRKLGAGDCFGEQALYDSSAIRMMSIQASKETKILALGREQLKEILGDQVLKIINKNQSRWSLQRHETLMKLTKMQQERIISNLEYIEIEAGTKVIEKTALKYSLVILLSGSLVAEGSTDKVCAKGDCLLLLANHDLRKLKGDVLTEEKTSIAFLKYGQIKTLLKGDIEQAVSNNANSHENRLMNYKFELKADADKIKIENIKVLKSLGQGQFGKVYLIKCDATTNCYALKIVKKKAVIEQGIEKHIKQEQKCLEIVSFPFLVNSVTKLEDKNSYFFVLEFISGLELFDAIREIGLA